MADQINDITMQARQGSVAAIIQVLNEELATVGVRIRAVFSDGVLQLLCEAADFEHLEQSHLVEQIKQILEAISPHNIRRVKINSRIVQEQQLLWLEEISRDSENQLLWSQQITLARPNIFKQLADYFQTKKSQKSQPIQLPLSQTVYPTEVQKQNQFQMGIMGGFFMSLLMLTLGVQVNKWINFSNLTQRSVSENIVSQSPSTPINNSQNTEVSSKEAFYQAVRLAQEAVANGKNAKSSQEWLAIAGKWQQAAELMASVSPDYSRYDVAVNRAELYQKNSDIAKKQAEKS
ncbi:MAG: hypothetical protein QNJ68_00855 [Microcoleaceae cyanobacterium MO_207.B10]|nr:hypothetical protein [Microcoleaceae cyanobacterium MO_207.B10]